MTVFNRPDLRKNSLSRTFLTRMLLVTIVSILLVGCLWTWQQYRAFTLESENLGEQMLAAYETLLKTEVKKSAEYIEYNKSLTEKQLRDSIRERIVEAHTVCIPPL